MSSNETAKANPKKIGKLRGCALILFGLLIVVIILAVIGSMIDDGSKGETQEQLQEVQQEPEPQLDNIKYKTVKMPDGKIWFAENLNDSVGKSKCYDNKEDNCKKCGRLYDWETAMKACPAGWHLPSNEEWETLSYASGGTYMAGEFLKSKSDWSSVRDGSPGNGTDKYGFSVLSCGDFGISGFKYYGTSASFWSATELNDSISAIIAFAGHEKGIGVGLFGYNKTYLKSVRCVNDRQGEAQKPQPDNKKYKTVKMPDGKVWFAENLNYAIGNSLCYDYKEENCEKCGRLYDWKTARKACPAGWHLPTKEEWDALSNALGGDEVAGEFLKSKSGWKMNNGTDKYGFSALPCDNKPYASRYDSSNYGASAYFRISTNTEADICKGLSMGVVVNSAKNFPTFSCNPLGSVRCIKDN